MNNENRIRGEVLSRFKSVSEFAQHIGWNYAKANRIVSGAQKPDTDDIRQMCEALSISEPGLIASVFSLI